MAAKTVKLATLKNIAQHLVELRCRTPRGGTSWSISSVQNLLSQAVTLGLLDDRPMPGDDLPRQRGRPPKSIRRAPP
jgi:hypothetical protein